MIVRSLAIVAVSAVCVSRMAGAGDITPGAPGGIGAGVARLVPGIAQPKPPATARLYVLDCGMLNIDPAGVARYHVTEREHDVFGDGTVVIKAAPGHTPGHSVLVLTLAKSGRIVVAGDLYHYQPERTFHRKPSDNEFNVAQSAASRAMIEEYLKKAKSSIWIQHDYRANARLKNSPAFYE